MSMFNKLMESHSSTNSEIQDCNIEYKQQLSEIKQLITTIYLNKYSILTNPSSDDLTLNVLASPTIIDPGSP